MHPAIVYLETDPEYIKRALDAAMPYTLVDIRDPYDDDAISQPGTECLCDDLAFLPAVMRDVLCTGDGFRWNPELPILSFQ